MSGTIAQRLAPNELRRGVKGIKRYTAALHYYGLPFACNARIVSLNSTLPFRFQSDSESFRCEGSERRTGSVFPLPDHLDSELDLA